METATNSIEPSDIPLSQRSGQLNAWKVLFVFLAYVVLLDVGQFMFAFAIGIYEGVTKTHLEDPIQILRILGITFSIILATVTTVIISWFFERDLFKGEQQAKIGWSWGSWFYLKMGLAGGAFLAGAIILISTLLPIDSNLNSVHFGLLSTQGISRFILIILMVVCAPIAEELLFRGVMFYGISRSWGQPTGCILVTLLFALSHITKITAYWPTFFALIFLGTFTLFLRLRSQSISPPMFLHSSYNLIVAIFVLLQEN